MKSDVLFDGVNDWLAVVSKGLILGFVPSDNLWMFI